MPLDNRIAPVENPSDDESTGESIPYNDAKEDHDSDAENQEDNDDEEDEEDEEGVYVVEKILGHDFAKNGTLLLQVKWKGYDDPADETMEPEENLLEGAKDLVEEYYRVHGGRPEKPQRGKRKSMTGPKQTSEKSEPKRRRKSRAEAATETPDEDDADLPPWVPRTGSWENEVQNVDTILRDAETSTLIAYLQWKNGKKSKVSLETCYDRCPRKMLKFYEEHL
ncbi:heterochromatin protein HP1 [Aspergillus nomiae NRRL 13137]|uniref:Heterochromatin protein HP1 n=1 Tax=Aspergillus nomiae NRRL (strain ATCC 15546 / NRRL 13137 / CBS 260.88 / M93) TaxID=1509407 RepID=A0A0L1IR17_ASPN3|nr:heterochromatin protein HP1 [Aspergillus nomiae NRRL 13137]KNG81840.1 heterochromatin protein HP1 [Aspergillus nomiae NRRL 13137]